MLRLLLRKMSISRSWMMNWKNRKITRNQITDKIMIRHHWYLVSGADWEYSSGHLYGFNNCVGRCNCLCQGTGCPRKNTLSLHDIELGIRFKLKMYRGLEIFQTLRGFVIPVTSTFAKSSKILSVELLEIWGPKINLKAVCVFIFLTVYWLLTQW